MSIYFIIILCNIILHHTGEGVDVSNLHTPDSEDSSRPTRDSVSSIGDSDSSTSGRHGSKIFIVTKLKKKLIKSQVLMMIPIAIQLV